MFNSHRARTSSERLVSLGKCLLTITVIAALSPVTRAQSADVEEKVVNAQATPDWNPERDTNVPAGFQENPFVSKKKKSKSVKKDFYADVKEPAGESAPRVEEDYAAGAARVAYEQALTEMRHAEEVERNEARVRAAVERRKVEAAANVERHQREASEYRLKQERAEQNIEMLQAEVKTNERREKVAADDFKIKEKSAQEALKQQQEFADRAEVTGQKVERAERELADVNRMIQRAAVESQRYQAEIAKNQADLAMISNERERVEGEYIDVQNEVMALKSRNKDLVTRRKALISEIADLNKRVNAAKGEFYSMRKETERMDKDVYDFEKKAEREIAAAHVDIKKYEDETAKLATARLRNEAEREHIAKKVAEAKQDVIEARHKHAKAQSEVDESQALVMESRYALEQNKSELIREYAGFEGDAQVKGLNAKKVRALASMADASDMLEGQKASRARKGCDLRSGPAMQAPVVGQVKRGSKLITWPADAGWSKVMNSSGSPQYVDSDCLEDVN